MLDAIEFPLPGSCYWSITSSDDRSFYYLTMPQNSKVVQLDYRFNPVRAYSASGNYGPIAYDCREGCFWASAVGNPGGLIQLNRRFEEIGRCAHSLGQVSALAYSPYRDSFLVVSACKSRLYRVYKDPNRCSELVKDYSPMVIQGVYVQESYIILALREGAKLLLGAARQDGTLVTMKAVANGIRYQILGITARSVNGRLALLARKFPHRDRQQAVREVILELPSPIEQSQLETAAEPGEPRGLEPFCEADSAKTHFYHCHNPGISHHSPKTNGDFPGDYARLKELQNMEEQVFRQVKGIKNINTKHYRCSPEGCEYLDPKDIYWNQNNSPSAPRENPVISPRTANIQELLEAVGNAAPQGVLDCRYLNQVCDRLTECGSCPPPCPPVPPCPPPPPRPPYNGCNDMIESIALVETALAHILNAEGEKLQAVLAKSPSTAEILAVNSAVYQVIIGATHLEQVLYDKLYALCKECPCWKCSCHENPHCPCHEEHPCDKDCPCDEDCSCDPLPPCEAEEELLLKKVTLEEVSPIEELGESET